MKELKYIKLFEAFESEKLSKVLKFIRKEDRQTFLEKIKNVCTMTNFPLSNLNDDIFQYLPFQKALELNVDIVECKAQSDWIKGEFCDSGRIKRTWGKGTRYVECPNCKGTGFTPLGKDTQYLKFWFNKDGKFLLTTGTDGVIRKQNKIGGLETSVSGKEGSFSNNFIDYTIGKPIDFSELLQLPEKTLVRVALSDYDSYIVAMTYKRSNQFYLLQNYQEGSTPGGVDWREYASYSWQVDSTGDLNSELRDINILLPKEEEEEEVKDKKKEEIDPYSLNNLVNFSRYGISITNYTDMEKRLKDAHFSLVLDLLKLKKINFKSTEDTKTKRKENRLGALSLKNAESIKAENFQRYLQLLSDKFDFDNSFDSFKKIVPRAFGWNKMLYYIVAGKNISALNSIVDYLFAFIREERVDYKESRIRDIKSRINDLYKNASHYNKRMNDNLSKINLILENEPDLAKKNKRGAIIKKLAECSELLNKGIVNTKIDSLGDLELVIQKIIIIKNSFSSGRFDFYKLKNFSDYLTEENYANYCYDELSVQYVDKWLRDLNEIEVIIKNLFPLK